MSVWDEWREQQEEKRRAAAEMRRQQPKPGEAKQPKEPAPKRAITAEELEKLRRLQRIRPAWWCGDGRFIEQFARATAETQITERQAWYIKVLWYKYRKQLGHDGPRPAGYE
jgi:hypothetical protein